jgi:hypothetical protein
MCIWQKRGVASCIQRLKRNSINKFECEYENWSPRIGCEEGGVEGTFSGTCISVGVWDYWFGAFW